MCKMERKVKNFIKNLLKFINYSDNQKLLKTELKLKEIVNGDISFKNFLDVVFDYTSALEKTDRNGFWLCDATKRLIKISPELTDESLIKLRKLISDSFALYEIVLLENGITLQISGNNFFMSDLKEEIEKLENFKNGKIREVRFIVKSVLHVNCNLQNDLWHGMSIFVWTDIFAITDNDLVWNFSGHDTIGKYEKDAGTKSDGNGNDGNDGIAGESGGNVLIRANKLKNAEHLTIISNGGNGSSGQDGGSGVEGINGVSVTKSDVDIIPLCAAKDWGNGNSYFYQAKSRIENMAKSFSSMTYYETRNGRWGNAYIQAPLKSGKIITYINDHLLKSLTLIKGTEGTTGGSGGSMGYSGEGGSAGLLEINVPQSHHLVLQSRNGISGKSAKGGYHGQNGIPGSDMGKYRWITKGWWYWLVGYAHAYEHTKYYGEGQNDYLSLNSSSSDSTEHIWSGYSNHFKYVSARYASEKFQSRAPRQENTTKQNRERQIQARAAKQVVLNEIDLLHLYKDNFSDNTNIDSISLKESTTETINEEQEQEMQVNVTVSAENKTPFKIEEQVIEASEIENVINKQLIPKSFDLKFLKKKYDALNQLGQVPFKDNVLFSKTIVDKSKYLIYNPYDQNNNSALLDTLNSEIIGRAELIQKTIPKIDSIERLPTSVIQEFIDELYQDLRYKKTVEHYRQTYQEFVIKTSRDTLVKLNELESALELHPELKDRFKDCINEPTLQKIFQEKLKEKNDKKILLLYQEFIIMKNQSFDWKSCFGESHKNVFKLLTDHINVCKRECSTFIELVAQLSRQQICYCRKIALSDKFKIQNSFNPSNEKTIYLFKIDDKFYQLTESNNLKNFDYKRNIAKQKYKQILSDIEKCRSINSIDKYLNDKHYEKQSENIKTCPMDFEILFNFVIDDDILFLSKLCFEHEHELREKLDLMKKMNATSTIHYMADRLRLMEHTNITIRDIYLIINTAIAFAEEDNECMLINWILVSQEPKHWICHITFLRLENYLAFDFSSELKGKWLNYLQNTNRNLVNLICLKIVTTDRGSIDNEKLGNILYLLTVSNPKPEEIANLSLPEWAFVLKEFYWKYKLHDTLGWKEENESFQKAIHLLLKIENLLEFPNTDRLVNTFGERKAILNTKKGITKVIRILQNIADESLSISDELFELIKQKPMNNWKEDIEKLMPSNEIGRNVVDLIHIITNKTKIEIKNENDVLEIAQNRILSKTSEYISSVKKINELTATKLETVKTSDMIKQWNSKISIQTLEEKKLSVVEMLIMINCAIKIWTYKNEKENGFRLRDTQLLAALIIIQHDRNTLLQVSTGEGKSLIIAAVAIVRVLMGEKVDIITTSSVLAKRDAKELQNLYSMFNITVGHNTDLQSSKRQTVYKNSQIIYGDLASFQRDYLLDKFYGKNIMSGRKLENILVDEVDSMLLDRGNNTLYLSNEIPEMDKLESIYLHIWTRILLANKYKDQEKLAWDTKIIARDIETSLYGLIDAEHIKSIFKKIDKKFSTEILKKLEDVKLIDENNCVTSNEIIESNIDWKLNNLLPSVSQLLKVRQRKIIILTELENLQNLEKNQVEKVWQILKDEKIIDSDGSILLESEHIQQMKNSLSTYTGLTEIFDPLIAFIEKRMKKMIDATDLYQLQNRELENQSEKIINILKADGVIDQSGHTQEKAFDYGTTASLLKKHKETEQILKPLLYLIQQRNERETLASSPNYFKPFITKNLSRWIENAKLALFLRAQDDYVIDVDRVSSDGSTVVTILDKDTGTDQPNSQWDSGLHQFIQLKHGCRLTPQSLKAVFISNVSYFKLYKHLNGLSGTLGSDVERQHLVDSHKVDFLTLPTFKPKQFKELRPFVLSTMELWKEKIFEETISMVTTKRRSALIICDTVEFVKDLEKYFQHKKKELVFEIRTYTRDYEQLDIIHEQKQLPPGYIIIATNLAGRGTDIKLNEQLILFGGLHVILTYLPANDRIEQQAMGRAARKGEPGSGQLIIFSKDFAQGESIHNFKLLKLKSHRRLKEAEHVSSIRKHFIEQLQLEEECFKLFKDVWTSKINEVSTTDKTNEILHRGILDKWALWLDNNITHGEKIGQHSVVQKCKDFLKTIESLHRHDDFLHKWVDDLAQLIQLGKCMIDSEKYDRSITHFNMVIKAEPKFCEAAHYYKSLSLTKLNSNQSKIQDELTKALTLFEERKASCSIAKALISNLKGQTATLATQSKSFEQQQDIVISVNDVYIKSIYDVVGSFLEPDVIIQEVKCKKIEADILLLLLSRDKIICENFKINDSKLNSIQFKNYCDSLNISLETLKKEIGSNKSYTHINQLKDNISSTSVPNREDFWINLRNANVFKDVKELYFIPKDKLKNVEPLIFNKLRELNSLHFQDSNYIYLYSDIFEKRSEYFIIEQTIFQSKFEASVEDYLEKFDCIVENQCGLINRSKLIDIDFEQFSSAKADALTSEIISTKESESILNSMVDEQYLKLDSHNKLYKPMLKFFTMDFNSSSLNIPKIYYKWITKRLTNCFAYKIEYYNLCKKLMPNLVTEKSLQRFTRGKNSISQDQAKQLVETLTRLKIIGRSIDGGYLIIEDPELISVDSNFINENQISPNAFKWIQNKLKLSQIEQELQFDQQHNSSVKIEIMSHPNNVLLGQMLARGIIERPKIINTENKEHLREQIVKIIRKEIQQGEFDSVIFPNYYQTLGNFQKNEFIEKITNFVFDGRGTLEIFKGEFDMITEPISKSTSLKARVEERQFRTNSLDSILIGQKKKNKSPWSFIGWIFGIVVSVLAIIAGVLLTVFGLPALGISLAAIGVAGLIHSISGLVSLNNKIQQTERMNAEKVSAFLKQLQEQVNESQSKTLNDDISYENVTRIVQTNIQKINFVKMTSHYETIIQENLNWFEENMSQLLKNEIEMAGTISNLHGKMRIIYNKINAETYLDELDERYLDSERMVELISPAFALLKTNLIEMLNRKANDINMTDIISNSKFQFLIQHSFKEVINYYKTNNTPVYLTVLDEVFYNYIEDVDSFESDQNLRMSQKDKLTKVEQREKTLKNAVWKAVNFELEGAKKEILLLVKTAFIERLNFLIDNKLSDMSDTTSQNLVEASENDLKGNKGSLIQNFNLINAEYNKFINKPFIVENLSKLKDHFKTNVQKQSLETLKKNCIDTVTIKHLKDMIFEYPSFFTEIMTTKNSNTLLNEMVESSLDKPEFEHIRKFFENKLNRLLLMFSKDNKFYPLVFKKILKAIQFSDIKEIISCPANILKLLVSSTFSITAMNKIIADEPDVVNQNNGQMAFTANGNELLMVNSSSILNWDDLSFCLNKALSLLSEKSWTNVTKITLLKFEYSKKNNIPIETILVEYLLHETPPPKSVTVYYSNGNVMQKDFRSFSSVDGLSVYVDQTFDFSMIKLFQEFCENFYEIVQLSELCEKNKDEINKNLGGNLNQKSSKNIFKSISLEQEEEYSNAKTKLEENPNLIEEEVEKEVDEKETNEEEEFL